MTPQVQQVFAAPMTGVGVHAALAPDVIGEDRLPQTGQPSDDLGDSFGKLMKVDATTVPGIKMPLPQTGLQPIEFGVQAAVAMRMLSAPVDPKAEKINMPDAVAPELKGQLKEVDPELALVAGLSDAFVVSLPIKAVFVDNPLPTMPPGAFKPDFAAPVGPSHPPPLPPTSPVMAETTPLAIGLTTIKTEPETPTADKAQSIPTPLPSPAPVPAILSPTLLSDSADTALPALPQHDVNSATAPPTKAPKIAENTALEFSENPQKAARATPAETAFHLRAGAGVINQPTDALTLSAPLPDRVAPMPFAASDETALPDIPADPTADPVALPDRAALPQTGFATDSVLATPPISGADQIKQMPGVIAQSGAFPTASLPVILPLPPRLSAGLVTLAKTTPNGPVAILLNPEELGHLRFEIHQKADQLRVVLSVERPETMDLLRRNADQLLGEFKAAGFSGATLSFGQWDQHSSDPRAPPAPPAPPPASQDRAFDPPLQAKHPHPTTELAASTGLNIRL